MKSELHRLGTTGVVCLVSVLLVSSLNVALGQQFDRPRVTQSTIKVTSKQRLFLPVESTPKGLLIGFQGAGLRDLAHQADEFVVEDFPLDGELRVELALRPFRLFGDQTRVVLGRKDGVDIPIQFDPLDIVFFTGRVIDHPGSDVFLAISDSLSAGRIQLGSGGETYRISSQLSRGRPTPPGQLVIFPARSTGRELDVPRCGVDFTSFHAASVYEPQLQNLPTSVALRTEPIRGMRTIELAIETDYEYFELFGDVDAAVSYVGILLGAVSQVFMRDANHRFEITFLRIWDNPDDLYNEPGGFDAFSAFVDHWSIAMGDVPRDTAQYLSGRRDLPFGGIAYLNAVCSSFGYSMIGFLIGHTPEPDTASFHDYDFGVSAHELGHNCGSPHTDGYSPPIDQCFPTPGDYQRGTIMSYCGQATSGGNAVDDDRFHTRVQERMKTFLSAVSCVIDDCNMNNVSDSVDISSLASPDVNENGVPDECEDCNGNDVLDSADIIAGLPDVDGDGIPDVCEPDCNENDVPDHQDIFLGTSSDAYGNNVPDECETDCNHNGVSDYTEIQADLTLDINRNALLDACEDCDGDGTPDTQELNGAHNVWVASDLLDVVGEYHGESGVLVKNADSGWLADPQDVVIDESGRVFVSSALDDRVVEFDRSGAYVGDFVSSGSGGLTYPTGLFIMPDGTLLVSSRDTNNVLRYDGASGVYIEEFVSAGSGGLMAPFGLAIGSNGNLFVTSDDNQVLEYDGVTGAFVKIFVSSADNGGLMGPRGLAFKRDGKLLVAGYLSDAVNEYDRETGAFLRVFHNGGTVYGPWGVRVGPNGNVYLTRDYEVPAAQLAENDDGIEPLHASTTRIYEYEPRTGNHLRSFLLGDDTGLLSPTGFAFMPSSGTDCNVNFRPDSCDISEGAIDADGNGVPDVCECAPPESVEPTGVMAGALGATTYLPRNRYLSFQPPLTPFISTGVALRVTFSKMPGPDDCPLVDDYSSFEGTVAWVGEEISDVNTPGVPGPTGTYRLQNTPLYRNWFDELPQYCVGANGSLVGESQRCDVSPNSSEEITPTMCADSGGMCLPLVLVSDCNIVPCAEYTIEAISDACLLAEENFSLPQPIATSAIGTACPSNSPRWADIVGTFDPAINRYNPPDGCVDFNDIAAMVERFKNLTKAPPRSWCDLIGGPGQVSDETLWQGALFNIDFADIAALVSAFQASDYPLGGPTAPNACP